MKKSGKIIASLMAMMMSVSTMASMSASAASHSVSESGNVFVNDWEVTASWNNGKEKLRYGYDTWAQNEDYCYSYVKYTSHSAKVTVGSLSETASGSAGSWSGKADVAHQAGTVTWYVLW